ncbi:MAG TPA: peroxiredoxin [Roseobacter sp.]|uniref:thioredoxin-dependent peroxiredoxin n=1 Tax=marine sediment metagenome TaxID=412755 RepID=A0A0F9RHL9_9ZZZZ|nr:peroxiredoxin [Roseobacter sp.]|tara:strand:- start:2971 stop:3432 length:462 start_codon:yes stop_codon:yes gene_type:complete|eukprot:GHVR01135121.1.p2 GENE.GHVR01135121.1~~GHVR01135121.1.p2  ORF type:complete len:154 (+),score=16.68 GHVR01135121.1:583-1044(+)
MPDISQPAPDFTMPVTGGGEISLSDLRGKIVVLYFYPRDDTPGCTMEAIEFSADLPSFRQAGAEVYGISRDTLAKHDRFAAKHDLTVPLLADVDGAVTQAYDVWVEKNMYGKKMMGIERATFLIDAQGNIARIWRKVKVAGHVQEVLNAVRAL